MNDPRPSPAAPRLHQQAESASIVHLSEQPCPKCGGSGRIDKPVVSCGRQQVFVVPCDCEPAYRERREVPA